MLVTIGGNCPVVAPPTSAGRGHESVQHPCLFHDDRDYSSDDFLLFLSDCATADAVLNRGSPLHGPTFSLFFSRWTRIVQGSAVALTKWFCDTSTRAAQEQPVVVLLRGRLLASWVLALGERGGHGDLRGSDRLSVIPYVHGRTELYCAQVCLA
jgi:hypothetical protein